MVMLWSSEVLHLTEALTNFLGVVARFPELVVVAGLTELPVTGEKTAAMVATMIVVVRTAELGLNLTKSSRIAAARNSGEIDLALKMRCSSALFLAGFLPCFSLFLGTLRCCVLSHDTNNRSMGLSGYDL
jgi:xanthine dehydrogenase iron-sulfur cluster and FAD-binding subunit A